MTTLSYRPTMDPETVRAGTWTHPTRAKFAIHDNGDGTWTSAIRLIPGATATQTYKDPADIAQRIANLEAQGYVHTSDNPGRKPDLAMAYYWAFLFLGVCVAIVFITR